VAGLTFVSAAEDVVFKKHDVLKTAAKICNDAHGKVDEQDQNNG
jgi:hypothetical protein